MSAPESRSTGSVDALALADEIEGAAALETVGKKWRRLPVGSPKLIVTALRHMAGATNARTCDVAQAATTPRLGGIGVDWWAESVKLYRQNQKLRKALKEQHDWHLAQGEQDFGDGIKLNMADEYADSGMCERTVAVLDSAAPQPPANGYGAWQPIETAPMDGTPIEVCNTRLASHAPVVVRWTEAGLSAALPDPHWCDAATADGSALYYNSNYFDFWKPTTALPSTDGATT